MPVRLSRRDLLLAAPALPLRALAQAEELRVMVNDVRPYSHREGQQILGMHPDMLQEMAQLEGLRLRLSSAPYARVKRALLDEAVDAVVALTGPDLDSQGTLVHPLHPVRYLIISLQARPIQSLAALRGKRLGMARGAYYNAAINDNPEVQFVPITEPFQGLRMLALERVDAVVSTDFLLAQALRQARLEGVQFAPPFDAGGGAYALYARPQLPRELIERLRSALARLQANGRLASIIRAHL
ncbi:MAG: transporter substrate-binding domain-containing protein [Inhella sp.]